MMVELKDYETIVDKYETMTDEKENSLGQYLTLKELCDMWWNCIKFYDKTDRLGYCYKDTENKYVFSFDDGNELYGKATDKEIKKWLDKVVETDNFWESDLDNYPTLSVYLDWKRDE